MSVCSKYFAVVLFVLTHLELTLLSLHNVSVSSNFLCIWVPVSIDYLFFIESEIFLVLGITSYFLLNPGYLECVIRFWILFISVLAPSL